MHIQKEDHSREICALTIIKLKFFNIKKEKTKHKERENVHIFKN